MLYLRLMLSTVFMLKILNCFALNQDVNAFKIEEKILTYNVKKLSFENPTFDETTYLNAVFELDDLYFSYNDLYSSSQLLDNAIQTINAKTQNTRSLKIAELHLRLGRNEMQLKSYSDAIIYFLVGKNICEIIHEYGDIYINLLNNIAIAYSEYGNQFLAKMYIDELISYYNELHNDIYTHTDEKSLLYLSNYAKIYFLLGDEQIAEEIFKHIIPKSLINTPTYTQTCNNYAILLMQQNRFKESISYFERIQSKSPIVLSNIVANYVSLEDYGNAIKCLNDYNTISKRYLISKITRFNQYDWENLWDSESLNLMYINNFVAYKSDQNSALESGYNTTLFCKTLPLQFYSLLHRIISESKDKNLKNTFEEYKAYRQVLSQTSDSVTIKHPELFRITASKEDSIIHSVKGLSDSIIHFYRNLNDISDVLNDDEIAIDFCYIPIDNDLFYGAYILRNNGDLKLISLSKIEDIDKLTSEMFSDEYILNEVYSNTNHRLYDAIWANIIPFLDGVKKIYFSPINKLTYINHKILNNTNGLRLSEQYSLIRVSSAKEIANIKQSQTKEYKSAILYGNIAYDMTLEDMQLENDKYKKFTGQNISNILSMRYIDNINSWNSITATKKEIDNIGDLLASNHIKYKLFERHEATEESFKSLDNNSPQIIHLATHGFALQSVEESDQNHAISQMAGYSTKDRYMQWSGLLFAGANNAWSGNFNLSKVEDGILTSEEISMLNLSNTDLIVLSACESGKGVINVNNVLGLQHAFKRAGVGSIVMSLWKVPDEVTSLLMTVFYTELFNGVDKQSALINAMKRIQERYPDPYYWGAWVILD